MAGPLAGVRILDVSSMMSGPWAADILGDQGADVIKIEVPGGGDHVRQMSIQSGGMSAMFVNINRSKRSLSIDLKSPASKEIFRRLVATSDAIVQNLRPGVVERLGISYEDLAPDNPGLVYLSISGFGEHGPAAHQRVYDPLVQALSGLTTVQAGSDNARPRLIRTVLPDKLTAIVGAQALTAALYSRKETGRGQHVRLSMLDAVLSFLWASDMDAYTFSDNDMPRCSEGSSIDLIFETADGYITVATNSNAEWIGLCQTLGHPEWTSDERFTTPAGRSEHIDARLEMVQTVLRKRTSDEWLGALDAHDVPSAPVLTRAEVISHPQVVASETIIEYRHPAAGGIRQTRTPARFLGTPVSAPRGAPRLGEHTAEILAELGFGDDELDDFTDGQIVGRQPGAVPS